jgi:hypothetical protein
MWVLINCESCIGAFLLTTLLPYLPCYYHLHIILFLHLLSTNHKCIQPWYFPLLYKPSAQKVKMVMENSLTRSSRLCAALVAVPVELWCLSTVMLLRVFNLVFCKMLFGNKYYILWHWLFCIHFLYSMCVNLILGHTYYENFVWP